MSDQYVGEIRLFGFPRIPQGWLACDGSLQPISQYETLYVLLGTTYGGDGVNTFGLPDLRGQVPVHQGNGLGLTPRPLGSNGGTTTVTLTVAQMPTHNHTMSAVTAAATSNEPNVSMMTAAIVNNAAPPPSPPPADQFYVNPTTVAAVTMAEHTVQGQGGNQPHDNMMPTLTANFCIATVGVFPSQS
ncbi:tail fiber protein [Luteibacter sp. PPL552]